MVGFCFKLNTHCTLGGSCTSSNASCAYHDLVENRHARNRQMAHRNMSWATFAANFINREASLIDRISVDMATSKGDAAPAVERIVPGISVCGAPDRILNCRKALAPKEVCNTFFFAMCRARSHKADPTDPAVRLQAKDVWQLSLAPST